MNGFVNLRSIDCFQNFQNYTKVIDFSGLTNIEDYGTGFLSGCTGLKTVLFGNNSKVRRFGQCFLYECRELYTIDLSSFTGVEIVEKLFMYKCHSIEELDFSFCSETLEFIDAFFASCCGLKKINFGQKEFKKLTVVKENFINACFSKLKKIDLSQFINIRSFKTNSCLYGLVDEINLSNFRSLGQFENLSHIHAEKIIINKDADYEFKKEIKKCANIIEEI